MEGSPRVDSVTGSLFVRPGRGKDGILGSLFCSRARRYMGALFLSFLPIRRSLSPPMTRVLSLKVDLSFTVARDAPETSVFSYFLRLISSNTWRLFAIMRPRRAKSARRRFPGLYCNETAEQRRSAI